MNIQIGLNTISKYVYKINEKQEFLKSIEKVSIVKDNRKLYWTQ